MGVKKEFSGVELNKDAGHGPDVRRLGPPVTLFTPEPVFQNHFRRSVLPRIYDRRMSLAPICGASKVNYSYFTALRFGPVFSLSQFLLFFFLSRKLAFTLTLLASKNFLLHLHLLNH
jgi:hypothetical protein